jgi:hypothetical protein
VILAKATLCSFTKLQWLSVIFQSHSSSKHAQMVVLMIKPYNLITTFNPNIQMLTMKLNNTIPTSKHKLIKGKQKAAHMNHSN